MGSIIEFPAFSEMLNGLENLRLHCAYMGYHRPGAAEEALERLGLGAPGTKGETLLAGHAPAAGVGRAVLTHPELLVLDEPANALDAAGMKQVRDLLRTLCRDWGTTVFFIQSSALRSGADSRYSGHSASGKAAAGDFFERAGCTELDLY